MPVQINEVIIRAVVDGNNAPKASSPPPAAQAAPSGGADAETAALVLEIIKEKNER